MPAAGLFSKELFFYTSFRQQLSAVTAPEVYGIWTDGSCGAYPCLHPMYTTVLCAAAHLRSVERSAVT
eukprot:SAG11_NODE_74_length_18043_cov_13.387818_3_plen_68_part_00